MVTCYLSSFLWVGNSGAARLAGPGLILFWVGRQVLVGPHGLRARRGLEDPFLRWSPLPVGLSVVLSSILRARWPSALGWTTGEAEVETAACPCARLSPDLASLLLPGASRCPGAASSDGDRAASKPTVQQRAGVTGERPGGGQGVGEQAAGRGARPPQTSDSLGRDRDTR